MAEVTVADELEKADELRQRGVLTQAEFDAYKAKLLGSPEVTGVSGSAPPPPPPTAMPPPPPPTGALGTAGGVERGGLGGAFARFTEATSGAVSDPGGYYQEHKKGIDEAAGAGLIAEGLGVVPGRWRVHGLGLLGMFFGLVLVLIGWGLMNIGKVPASYTGVARATVTALNLSTTGNTGANGGTTTTCYPTATFVVAGRTYSVANTGGQSPCGVSIGSTVTVDYQPTNPANAKWKTGHVPAIVSWALVVLGSLAILGGIIRIITRAAMFGGGAALLYKGIKRDRRPSNIAT